MKGTSEQIIDFVSNGKEDQEYICEKMTTQAGRSLAQNRTWSKILTAIGLVRGWDLAEAKKITLIYHFGYETTEYEGEVIFIPNETSTKDLPKDKATKYLDFLITYCKDNQIPVVITPREISSLYDSYKEEKPEHPMKNLDNNF